MKLLTPEYTIEYYQEEEIIILENLIVNPAVRNQGIGTQAMNNFLSKFSMDKIELHAYPQDDTTNVTKLVNFYKKFGFRVVAGDDSIGYEMKNY